MPIAGNRYGSPGEASYGVQSGQNVQNALIDYRPSQDSAQQASQTQQPATDPIQESAFRRRLENILFGRSGELRPHAPDNDNDRSAHALFEDDPMLRQFHTSALRAQQYGRMLEANQPYVTPWGTTVTVNIPSPPHGDQYELSAPYGAMDIFDFNRQPELPVDNRVDSLTDDRIDELLELLDDNESDFDVAYDSDNQDDSDDSNSEHREPTYTPFAKRTLTRADEHTLRLVTGRICSVCHEHMIIHVDTGCTIAPNRMCHECMVMFVTTQTKLAHRAHCPCGAELTGLDLILTPSQMTELAERRVHINADLDPDLMRAMESLGAQICTRCNNVVEKLDGCNHIVCICKHEFCYLCGASWHTCECPMYD
jgi:hypothetical protein